MYGGFKSGESDSMRLTGETTALYSVLQCAGAVDPISRR
jgi:hypothetical protein